MNESSHHRPGNDTMSTARPSTSRNRLFALLFGLALGSASLVLVTACDVESANSVSRTVGANVSGVYSGDSGQCSQSKLVSANSGGAVTTLDVRQTGDQLEAIDNNGIIFRGTIGSVFDSSVTFTLEGSTTLGGGVVISGTITVGGGEGVMRGTWIEDNLFSTVCGSANGPSAITNSPTPTNSTSAFFRVHTELTPSELAAYRKTALWFMEG